MTVCWLFDNLFYENTVFKCWCLVSPIVPLVLTCLPALPPHPRPTLSIALEEVLVLTNNHHLKISGCINISEGGGGGIYTGMDTYIIHNTHIHKCSLWKRKKKVSRMISLYESGENWPIMPYFVSLKFLSTKYTLQELLGILDFEL